MNAKLRQHYFHLWELTSSLKKNWWYEKEKRALNQFLRDAVARDLILSDKIDIQADDFLGQLETELQTLISNAPDLPEASLPPRAVIKDTQEYLQKLAQTEREIPFVFQDKPKKSAAVDHAAICLLLKKHGLIDRNGEFASSIPEQKLKAAQKELSQHFTQQRYQQAFQKSFRLFLQNNLPFGLLKKEFDGDYGSTGIINSLSREYAQTATLFLYEKIEHHLGGEFNFFASDFQQALNRALEETQSKILAGELFPPQKLKRITTQINIALQNSPNFFQLAPQQQKQITDKISLAIAKTTETTGGPKTVENIEVKTKDQDQDFELQITTAAYQKSTRPRRSLKAVVTSPKNRATAIIKTIQSELKSPETQDVTIAASRFVQDFSRDPLGAGFRYIGYSLAYSFLPRPITNLLFPSRDSLRSKIKLWYGVSINPYAQRQFMERVAKNTLKTLGKKIGFYTRDYKGDYHFILTTALGWTGDRLVTGIGEKLGQLADKLKLPSLGNAFRKSIGRNRNRKKSLFSQLFFSLPLALLKLIPKSFWFVFKKLPVVNKFSSFISKKWVHFRYLLESKLPIFKYLRIGKGAIGGLLRALPHGALSGALGYIASGGNPGWAIGLGGSDFVFHFLKNLGKIPEIAVWAGGGHHTFFGKGLAGIISSKYFYIPFKLPLITEVFTTVVLPAYGINVPLWAKWLGRIGSAAAEYGLVTKVKPWLALKIPPVISRIFGAIGKFFSKGFFGGLLGFQLATFFGLPLWAKPLSFLVGTGAWYTLARFIPRLFNTNILGIIGHIGGQLLVFKLGLTGLPAILLPFGFNIALTFLGRLGWQALGKWFATSGLNALLSSVAATGAAISTGAIVSMIIAFLVLIAGTILVIFIFSSAFVEQKALSSGVISPYLPINKVLTSTEKNEAEAITALNYTLTYGLTTNAPGNLKDIQIRDRFKQSGRSKLYVFELTGHLWFDYDFTKPSEIEASSFNICPPRIVGNYFLWFSKHAPEFPSDPPTCPEKIAPLQPGREKTITMRLALKKPLDKILKSGQLLCNEFGISGKIADEKHFSSLSICINRQGEMVSGFGQAVAPRDPQNATHLAEKAIYTLNQCGIGYVQKNNWRQVENCLQDSQLKNKQLIIDQFHYSVFEVGPGLHCVGFVRGVMSALGKDPGGNRDAKDYLNPPPPDGYDIILNMEDITQKDLVINRGSTYGHIGITIEKQGDYILVAQAWGPSGLIQITRINPAYFDGFLRPK